MFVEELAAVEGPTLVNARTGRVLASSVECAFTSATRRKGLLGRKGLSAGAAIVISRSNAVHTIGMHFAIDIVFVDRHGRVKKIARNVPPFRMAACFTASTTIEMVAGSLSGDALVPGDQLVVATERYTAPGVVRDAVAV